LAQGLVDTDTCPQTPARSEANTWALVGYFFEGCFLAVYLQGQPDALKAAGLCRA